MSQQPGSPSSSDNRKPDNYREAFQKNISSSLISPCEQASKAAMVCLDQNNYNHAKCKDFFQTYKDCKKTWINQRKEDRKKGIV
ncbi:hypothetical protein PILCRDRAFT_70082 [Piloderma croceum F 1598]|uniref:Cytochrome c oxidase-assembly factor COX23, mitochondrial n=1 Tax=Piloderma croceum (strain F 1598) TaxID=765440 RepID=A0A0C3FWV0_PILCF|nr:hypothetical protein PILCRDRAFT_70082 [Piloderma croceum F 1598]